VKFATTIHRSTGLLDVVHMDVWGPAKRASLGGHRFFVSFVDEYSRQNWVYTLRHKKEVLEVSKWRSRLIGRSRYSVLIMMESARISSYDSARTRASQFTSQNKKVR